MEDKKIITARNSYSKLLDLEELKVVNKNFILSLKSNLKLLKNLNTSLCKILMLNFKESTYINFSETPVVHKLKNNIGIIPFLLDQSYKRACPIFGVLYLNNLGKLQIYYPVENNNLILDSCEKINLIYTPELNIETDFNFYLPDIKNMVYILRENMIEDKVDKIKITCTEEFQKRLVDSPFCISNDDCLDEYIKCKECKLKYIDWEIIRRD